MPQCSDDVQQLNVRMARLEGDVGQIKTAFMLNDRGTEDYDGHRRTHYRQDKEAEESEKTMSELKAGATKQLLKWVLAAAVGVFTLGIGPYLRGLFGLVN